MRRLRRNTSGAVLVEFALSALLFFMSILTALEWSVEMYVRHATERAMASALRFYAETGDLQASETAARTETIYIVDRCLEPLDIRLYDSILGVDLTDPSSGYSPTGTASDDAAVVFKIGAVCRWSRFTPFLAAISGPEMVHSISGFSRIR